MVTAASPPSASSLPPFSRPAIRASSEAANSADAPAPEAAWTRPTRCCSRWSDDQSAKPAAAAGSVPASPNASSSRDARPAPGTKSSTVADVQKPMGSATRAGWTG